MASALRSVALDVDLERDPMRMSGGQRQRLVMASVLVQQPMLLLLDEPSSDMDPASRTQLRQTLRQLRGEGMSLLMTEQDHEDLQLVDRVMVLDEGQLVWEGLPDVLLRDPPLMRQRGIRPLPLTECFEDLACDPLPITVEEAWVCAENLHLMIEPPASVLDDTVRLGEQSFFGRGGTASNDSDRWSLFSI